jgi:hypothetical protein
MDSDTGLHVSSSTLVTLKALKGPTHRIYGSSNNTTPNNQDVKFSTSGTSGNNIISKLKQPFMHYMATSSLTILSSSHS